MASLDVGWVKQTNRRSAQHFKKVHRSGRCKIPNPRLRRPTMRGHDKQNPLINPSAMVGRHSQSSHIVIQREHQGNISCALNPNEANLTHPTHANLPCKVGWVKQTNNRSAQHFKKVHRSGRCKIPNPRLRRPTMRGHDN